MTLTRAMFMDVDGVLHSIERLQKTDVLALAQRCAREGSAKPLLDAGLFNLTGIVDGVLREAAADDVMIVIHSSWRDLENVGRFMREALGSLGERFQGMTSADLPREKSIEDLCRRAGIVDYLIVDDARHEFTPGNQHLVVTNPLKGVRDMEVLAEIFAWAVGLGRNRATTRVADVC